MNKQKKKRILIVVPGFIPSTIIGVMRPLGALASKGEISLRLRLANFSPFLESDIRWCDIAVFSRNCEIGDLQLLYELKRLGKKIIYDIDDNFEEIPLSSDVAIYHRAFFRLHVVRRFFELADVVRVYSERMEERVRSRGADPEFVRCYFDMDLVNGLALNRSDRKIKIAYPTGRLDDRHLEKMLYTAVANVLRKYSDRVEFHLWRKAPPAELRGVPGVVLNKPVRGYDNFIRAFFQAGFDIGLAPGVDTPFFRSKTNNKYREFGGCGIAGVYSNFPPYSNTIEDGVSGLLVNSSTEAWTNAITRLVEDESLRRSIVEAARKDVATNYTFDNELAGWRRAIDRASNTPEADMNWMPDYGIWYLATVDLRVDSKRAVDVAKVDREIRRLADVREAVSRLPRIGLVDLPDPQSYLSAGSRKGYGATFYLVNTEAEFEACMQLLGLGNSAIIDMTLYEGEVFSIVRRLNDSIMGVPVSCIVRDADLELISTLDLDMIKVWGGGRANEVLFPNYSIDGYPAIYANVIEHHIQYGQAPKRTRLAKFFSRFYGYTHFFEKNMRRGLTLWKYLGWRVGRRTF